MANIRVTPETLDAQGKSLIDYASNLNEILNSIDGKINEIIDGWDGLAQDAYYEMYNTMKESLKQFPELVESLGTATQSSAKAFGDVDEALRNSFSQA